MKYGNIWVNCTRKKIEVLLRVVNRYTQVQDKGNMRWIGLRALGRAEKYLWPEMLNCSIGRDILPMALMNTSDFFTTFPLLLVWALMSEIHLMSYLLQQSLTFRKIWRLPICQFFEFNRMPTCPLQCKSPSPQWTPTTTKGAASHLEFWVNFGDLTLMLMMTCHIHQPSEQLTKGESY